MSSPSSPMTPAKQRLTELEKKNNHIQSEKKRREAIRLGFDRIADMVPGMKGHGRSEAVVLQATVEHMKDMKAKQARVEQAALAKGFSSEQIAALFRDTEIEVRKREDELAAQRDAAEAAKAAAMGDQPTVEKPTRRRSCGASRGAAGSP